MCHRSYSQTVTGMMYGTQFTEDKQHIFYCFNILCIVILLEPQLLSQSSCLEIASTLHSMISLSASYVCVNCFYVLCLPNFFTHNSHKGLDQVYKQATTDN